MQSSLSRSTRITIVASSLVSLLPLLACWPQFARLFFFHDEWEMLDGANRLGLGP